VDSYLQSGTMYFKNNDRVIKLLESWIKLNEKDLKQWDQWTLQVALQNSNVTVTQLPPEYIGAPFVLKKFSIKHPVILHTMASERNKDIGTDHIKDKRLELFTIRANSRKKQNA